MATRMQQRRGTAAQWTASNPVLGAGEIGFETDTNKFKIGNGSTAWTSLSYFIDGSSLIDGAPDLLNTLNELAAALGDDPAFFTTVANNLGNAVNVLSNSQTATSNALSLVQGNVAAISNSITSIQNNISTQSDTIQGLTNSLSSHGALQANVHGISNTLNLAYMTDISTVNNTVSTNHSTVSNLISNHSSATANVHGITNALAIVYTADLEGVSNSLTTHSSANTSVHGISNTLNLVYTNDSRLSDERTPSSTSVTAAKIASDAVETGKIANAAVTAAKLASDSVETAKIKDLAVTNAKLEGSIAQSKITDLVSDLSAKLESSTAATTYAPIASPTFTGTVSGVTKSHVGLGNVDNTTDALKPVSTATQTALDLKAPLASPALTGTPTAPTANTATNTTQIATTAFVQQEISILTTGAPGLLNTLDELAAALGDDENFAATTANTIALKAPLASPTFTGTVTLPTGTVTSAMILDGTIVDGDINASAAIAQSKISGLSTSFSEKAPLASPTFTGLVTVAANGIAYTDGTQTKEGVPSRTPIISKTDSYTLSATSERDSLIEVNKSSASTITIPLNSAVGFPIGTTLDVLQTGAGQVTIAGDTGVTVDATPGLKLRTRWSSATLFKRDTNTWVVFGDLTA